MDQQILECDKKNTSERTAVRALYQKLGIVPESKMEDFSCPNLTNCSRSSIKRERKFFTGNWAYVGDLYGTALVAGIPARIMVIGMDRGAVRHTARESFGKTQQQFRNGARKRWNNHMGGVDLVLSRLLDETDPNLRSRQFALTNAVKCVENTGVAKTRVTQTMIKLCSAHLAKEIELLDPDILIPQGDHPITTVTTLVGGTRLAKFDGVRSCDEVSIVRSGERWILATPHGASRMKGFGWKADVMPEYYERAIEKLRQLYKETANHQD